MNPARPPSVIQRSTSGVRSNLPIRFSASPRSLALLVIVLHGISLPTFAQTADPRSQGTRDMAVRLASIAENARPAENPFLNAARAAAARVALSKPLAPRNEMVLRFQLATELLQAGNPMEALKEYRALEHFVETNKLEVGAESWINLQLNLALCHLRQAELINCQSNHNADSCLLPLQGGGIHVWKEPSRQAVPILTNLLARHPNDLPARWLLNIASMTLGEYPDKVPAAFLIPPDTFKSEYDLPRFRDVAIPAGVAVNDLSGGTVVDDLNGDGFLDILISSLGLRDPLHLFINNGNGTFTDRTREAGLEGLTGGLNMVHADYNNDGHTDVFILRGAWMQEQGLHPNSLLQNRGDGTFDDVTEAAGLLSFHPTQTAAWFDFNGDGWLDLFVGNESRPTGPRHPCELFRNNRDGTFTEIAAASGAAAIGYVKGVTAGDFNNDGRPDLYLSFLDQSNRLLRNDGPPPDPANSTNLWKFTNVARAAGVTDPFYSFPTWFFDFDNDGWQDIFVSGYNIESVADIAADYLGLKSRGERPRLYRNRGDGTFEDVTQNANLHRVLHTMGSNFGDLDNDGWPDFYLGTGNPDLLTTIPNRMFRNDRGLRFLDVTTSGGFGNIQKGHAVAFADLDNDGDQDVFENMGGAYTGDTYPDSLFENPGPARAWIKLQLQGTKANRPGIGARIRIDTSSPKGPRTIHHTVGTGGSFGSNPLRQEIGLDNATAITRIQILWPGSGTRQQIGPLQINTAYRIREDSPTPTPVPLKSFKFPAATAAHHHH